MIKLDAQQKAALKKLIDAHQVATNTGLFDEMYINCDNPDSINDVCDAADYMQNNIEE